MKKPYIQHKGRVIDTDSTFTHVMAIALDPRTNYKEGVIRCITSREGDVGIPGYIDRSELHKVLKNSGDTGDAGDAFKIGYKLNIKDELKVVGKIKNSKLDFIGLEDPDIWIDEKKDLLHLYFTLPLIGKKTKIHLGHAVGKNLDSLVMKEPILLADKIGGAKELSIAPLNKKGFRYNLVESGKEEKNFSYSVVRVAITKDMNKKWKFGDIIFHPKEHKIAWIGGHASPGPLFSTNFIDVGEGKRLGLINGREANNRVGSHVKYGIFSVGLFIYDYENGKIDWVSKEPLIRDSEAVTITFSSQFVETGAGEGILYAHVDDSFVRAYTLKARDLRKLLPTNIKRS